MILYFLNIVTFILLVLPSLSTFLKCGAKDELGTLKVYYFVE